MTTTRHFAITIMSDHPDAEAIALRAAEKVACELDWGDNCSGDIDLFAHTENVTYPAAPIAAWIFEPGNGDE